MLHMEQDRILCLGEEADYTFLDVMMKENYETRTYDLGGGVYA